MKNTILLNTIDGYDYFITGVTEEYLIGLREANKNKKLEEYPNPYNIDFKNIILQGDGKNLDNINSCGKVSPYLQSFNWNTGGTTQVHYRNYGRTIEQQEKMAWLINQCPDIRMSWRSIMRVIRTDYAILWKKQK